MIFKVTLIAPNAQGTHDTVLVDQTDVVSRTNRPGGGSTVITVSQGTLLVIERGPDFQAQIDTETNKPPFAREQLLNDVGLTVAMRTYIDNNQLSPGDILRKVLASDLALTNAAAAMGLRVVDLVLVLIRISKALARDPSEDGVVSQIVLAQLAGKIGS